MNKSKKIYLISIISFFIIIVTLTVTSFYEKNKIVKTPIMYVGEEPINQIEYAFYYTTIINNFYNTYSSYISNMNIDINNDLYSQECYFDGYDSWGQFFDNTTEKALQEKKALYIESKNNNFKYDYNESYNTFLEEIARQAKEKNISIDNMYKTIYGKYANKKEIKRTFIEYYTANAYKNDLIKKTEITNKEIEKYYKEHSKDYDLISYRIFTINANVTEDMTDEQKSEKMLLAKNKAKEFYEKIYDEDTFKELCIKNSDDTLVDSYKNNDLSLHTEESYDSISSVYSDWLFNCKKEKETTYIEDTENYKYHIIYYIGKTRDETRTVSIRQVLITPEVSNISSYLPTEEDYSDAKNKIEEIEKEFITNGKNEDAIKKLAEKYSDDNGSSSNGGLVYDIEYEKFDKEMNDWLFNENRKEGDYKILKTSYGYHLVYFISKGEPSYKISIKSILIDEKIQKVIDDILKKYPLSNNSN